MSVRSRKCKQVLRHPREWMGLPVSIVGGGHPLLEEVLSGVMTPRRWRKTRRFRPFRFRWPKAIYFYCPDPAKWQMAWMDEATLFPVDALHGKP